MARSDEVAREQDAQSNGSERRACSSATRSSLLLPSLRTLNTSTKHKTLTASAETTENQSHTFMMCLKRVYHVVRRNYNRAMKVLLRYLSDVCWRLGFPKASAKLFVLSLDTTVSKKVRVDIEMSDEVDIEFDQAPQVTFEDKEAIAALVGYDFNMIAVVNSALDVN